MRRPMRIMVVDDHDVVVEGLASALGSGPNYAVVATAGTARRALEIVEEMRIDVALVDLRLPDMLGVTLCEQLRATAPQMRIVILSSYVSEDVVRDALQAGASAYVSKTSGLNTLRATLDAIVDETLQPEHAQQIVRRLHEVVLERMPTVARPTPQHERVLELAAQGLTNRQIGERMFISESTVRFHVQKLKGTFGARTRTELIAKAIRSGVIARSLDDLGRWVV